MALVIRTQRLESLRDENSSEVIVRKRMITVRKDALTVMPDHNNLGRIVTEAVRDEIRNSREVYSGNERNFLIIMAMMPGDVAIIRKNCWRTNVSFGYQPHSLKAISTDVVTRHLETKEKVRDLVIPNALKEEVAAKMDKSAIVKRPDKIKEFVWHFVI